MSNTMKQRKKYIYSKKYKIFSINPAWRQIPDKDLENTVNAEFKELIGYNQNDPVEFVTNYDLDKIKANLANLNQLLIEVTDGCNLQCKYCGYGDLYNNYDKRNTKQQQFLNVKLLIDHLASLWRSKYNTSYQKEIAVGFYGGEPLLNVPLIKETITYLESLSDIPVHFSYNMTTNSILLDRYMDFLAEKKFKLLLSLDGDELGSSYRVDKQGKGSFKRVFANIKLLQDTYPEYFDKYVNFNAVLHDRNSVESTFMFIKSNFSKVPRIAELNTNGLSEKGEKELMQMFRDKFNSFNQASVEFKTQEDIQMEHSQIMAYHSFVRNFSGNYYNNYFDLFDANECRLIPTGTCRPFERKIFLTVNGKILPCEKIGQEHVLGKIDNNVLMLDYEQVEAYYKNAYEKVVRNCKTCLSKRSCGQCIFLLKERNERENKEGKFICPSYMGEKVADAYFAQFLTYAEEHPDLYEEIMKNIATV